jgi:hypothetical protein
MISDHVAQDNMDFCGCPGLLFDLEFRGSSVLSSQTARDQFGLDVGHHEEDAPRRRPSQRP